MERPSPGKPRSIGIKSHLAMKTLSARGENPPKILRTANAQAPLAKGPSWSLTGLAEREAWEIARLISLIKSLVARTARLIETHFPASFLQGKELSMRRRQSWFKQIKKLQLFRRQKSERLQMGIRNKFKIGNPNRWNKNGLFQTQKITRDTKVEQTTKIAAHARQEKRRKTNELTEEDKNKLTGRKTEKPRKTECSERAKKRNGKAKKWRQSNKQNWNYSPPAFHGLQP